YVQEFIRHIGAEKLHVISVCQPTVPVLAAVSLMAGRGETTPRSLVMMGGPIDTRQSPTQVNDLAVQKPLWWFEHNLIHHVPANYPGRGRRVYPGFLQHTGFVAMNPERHFQSHWDFYEHLVKGDLEDAASHRRFYDEYNAVLDMPAEYYLDTVRIVFQQHLLPRGEWDVRGERVRPGAIRDTALLTIEGELDDISGQGQTRAAHRPCTGIDEARRQHLTVEGAGHYGIFSGRRWRTQVYPQVRDFIARHAG
ncbi:MAG TPA: polyhydroxyalkanoate depolymerase, partial [Lysobacter sp.]